jgi:eukaryotic-like serine/threonine-protein kinase
MNAGIGQRYAIARRLGEGGMSRVYLCWDERLLRWCAVKVMSADAVGEPILRARFVQEARTLARIEHPNLVRLFDLVDTVACPYMVMEYVEGGTVAARLDRGRVHLHHALAIVADTAAALHAAHEAGVIHRDVKPQNLLLDPQGSVKVGDFGVARVQQSSRLTQSNMSLGTLAYMPPEQHRDASKVDFRADIYGAGATLFAISTGRRPTSLYTDDRETALALVPAEVRPIVRRATELVHTHRYESVRVMEEALREVLGRVPLPADAPPLVDQLDPPPDRPPTGADVVLEPGELDGTDRAWSSSQATVVLEQGFRSIDPSRNSVPPTTRLMSLPPRASWLGRALGAGVVLAIGVACGGGCMGSVLALFGATLPWWPGQ